MDLAASAIQAPLFTESRAEVALRAPAGIQAGDTGSENRMLRRFQTSLEAHQEASQRFEAMRETWAAQIPDLESYIVSTDRRTTELLTELAGRLDNIEGVTPQARGTLVHQVAELRTLYHLSTQVASGRTSAEQTIIVAGGRIELDLVTVHKDAHYIHDYKPINLGKITATPWAGEFQDWLEQKHQGDYRKVGSPYSMPFGLREHYVQFLRQEMAAHIQSLDSKGYRSKYATASGIEPRRIRYSIIPYWTWHPGE
jgi:hypothetical protein